MKKKHIVFSLTILIIISCKANKTSVLCNKEVNRNGCAYAAAVTTQQLSDPNLSEIEKATLQERLNLTLANCLSREMTCK